MSYTLKQIMDGNNTNLDHELYASGEKNSTATEDIDDVKSRSISHDSEDEVQVPTDVLQDGNTLPKCLTLDVGGRKFKVSSNMLLDYGLFRHQLLGKYSWTPEPDGSYFLDHDPDLFEHILRYMRCPAVFPLFYNSTNGFDYDLYNRLEKEAEYFQIWKLHAWIRDKKYFGAVTVKHVCSTTIDMGQAISDTASSNESIDWQAIPHVRKVYLCPRQIPVHKGHPELCGAACHKVQADNDVEYDEVPYLQMLKVKREIIFDAKVCILD